jgi:hypothetical protein
LREVIRSLSEKLKNDSLAAEQPMKLASWLSLCRKSIPGVYRSLQYWYKLDGKSTEGFIRSNPSVDAPATPCFDTRDDVADVQGAALRMMMDKMRMDRDVGPFTRSGQDPFDDPEFEIKIFKRLRILLPAKELLDRHPMIKKLVLDPQVTDKTLRLAEKEVLAEWVPNFMLFVSL